MVRRGAHRAYHRVARRAADRARVSAAAIGRLEKSAAAASRADHRAADRVARRDVRGDPDPHVRDFERPAEGLPEPELLWPLRAWNGTTQGLC